MDGPVGELICRPTISHFRPAHVHFLINVPGYEPLITHLFEEGADYLDSDVVFGTKAELVVPFEEREPGPTPDGGTLDRAVVGGPLRLRPAAAVARTAPAPGQGQGRSALPAGKVRQGKGPDSSAVSCPGVAFRDVVVRATVVTIKTAAAGLRAGHREVPHRT